MEGMNIVLAGGSGGLGAKVAELAAERGAAGVGIIDVNMTGALDVLKTCKDFGAETAVAIADISLSEAAHGAFDELASSLGRIDTLVNLAAIYPRKPLLEITDDEWDAENALNIKGTYHLMVAAVKHMKQHVDSPNIAGRIVNISSVDAFKAHPQNAHYAATKAAVVSLTRSFAHEFAADQILVNSVAPAGIATEKAKAAGFLGELAAANPLNRAAEPSEMAEWVLMAGGPRNTYMTGENIIVSGGYIYA
ncbi:MAG: SDR family oxidoreductase [Pseudomonadota bacterium]